jgi:glutamate-1-semialdehyde 2,1-aminomutase
MSQMLPAGRVFQAGTLSGNPVATAAGIATLKAAARRSALSELEELSGSLAAGLTAAASAAGIPHTLARVGSMMTLFFHPDPVTDWDVAAQCDKALFAKFFWGLIDRGVYLPCSQYEALFVSAAHTQPISNTRSKPRPKSWRRSRPQSNLNTDVALGKPHAASPDYAVRLAR